MEILEQHPDLEQVCAVLGHRRIGTTQVYTQLRPPQLFGSVRSLSAGGHDQWFDYLVTRYFPAPEAN
jgi:hypothetical protein